MTLTTNRPGRCEHCSSVLVYDHINGLHRCTNLQCAKRLLQVEAPLWCPDCDQPFPRGTEHTCGPKGVPSEAEMRAFDVGKVIQADFGGDPYKINAQLAEDLGKVVDSYIGRISLAAAIGVLEITKINLWSKHNG